MSEADLNAMRIKNLNETKRMKLLLKGAAEETTSTAIEETSPESTSFEIKTESESY